MLDAWVRTVRSRWHLAITKDGGPNLASFDDLDRQLPTRLAETSEVTSSQHGGPTVADRLEPGELAADQLEPERLAVDRVESGVLAEVTPVQARHMPIPEKPARREAAALLPTAAWRFDVYIEGSFEPGSWEFFSQVVSATGANRTSTEPEVGETRQSGRARRAPIRYEGVAAVTALKGYRPVEIYEPMSYKEAINDPEHAEQWLEAI
ncbi:MAG: hypothetical protein M1816_004031 [Peltula sp. TS41687]|nr:MAG: hypothetical protein M1816_004031 [Peltula sp. TS41687]